MQIAYDYYTLKNGLAVILLPSDTVNSVQVTGLVRTGSAIETTQNEGISHFIEHVAASENQKWPDHEKFEEEKELRGGTDNAYTSKEEIKYYISVPFSEADFGIEVIFNTLFNCTVSSESVERQRNIIIDEISKADDDVNWQNTNFIWQTTTANKTGYGLKIAGSKEQIALYSRSEIEETYKLTHQPNNILLNITGNFKKELIDSWLTKFESIKNIDNNLYLPLEGNTKGLRINKKYDKTDLVYTTLVFDIPKRQNLDRKEKYALKFIFTVLCGPLTSRLMRRLRERENLLYSIDKRLSFYSTFSNIKIMWESPQINEDKIFNIVIEELIKLFSDGINEAELIRYKKFITNRTLLHYDDIYEVSDLIETQVTSNEQIEPDVTVLNKIIEDFDYEYISTIIKKYRYILDTMNVVRFGNLKLN